MNNDELLVVIKDMFEKKTDEIKQYVDEKINGQGVLIEGLRSDIKAVAEGHGILDKRITEVHDSLRSDIKAVAEGHGILHKRITEVHSSLDRKIDGVHSSLDKKIDEVKYEIRNVKQELHIVRDYLAGVDKKLNKHESILEKAK